MAQPELILVAEDSAEDFFFLERALQRSNVPLRLHRCADGEEAKQYLSGAGIYADRTSFPLPALLLLDLNMPNVTGFEVLSWIKAEPFLKRIPVITFTSSNLKRDVDRSYDLGTSSHVVKPVNAQDLEEIVKAIHKWWLSISARPGVGENDV